MKLYAGMFIIRPTLTEDGYKAVTQTILNVFTENNSKVLEVKEWGMKDLAYEIDDLRKGYYVVFKVEATVEAVAEFDRVSNINEKLIRHILVKE
jgi:small subunit ribosomal protein S6